MKFFNDSDGIPKWFWLIVALQVALVIGVGYAAIHFLLKYW